MVTIDNLKVEKVANYFYCDKCNYTCYKKNHFDKHLSTLKHKNNENDNNDNKKVVKNVNSYEEINIFTDSLNGIEYIVYLVIYK